MSQNNVVNDIHSQLNATTVAQIVQVQSLSDVRKVIIEAGRLGRSISVAGKRFAMGGQQFGKNTILIDTTAMNQLLDFDEERGLIDVEAGMQWPALITHSLEAQSLKGPVWGIAQKQPGANSVTIGGSLASNGHGTGLAIPPMIADIESFTMVDAFGEILTCSRDKNSELFHLVIGGYGLFGVVCAVRLRLTARHKLKRMVEIINVDQLMPTFEQRISDGFWQGEFQFSMAEQSDSFMREGVLTCYLPVDRMTPISSSQKSLSEAEWRELMYLAHSDKAGAYRRIVDHLQHTTGQIYHSDTYPLGIYLENYHQDLDKRLAATDRATDVITEIFVPPDTLADFMAEARTDFLKNNVNLIFGSVRLIERDAESFLAWATQPYACVTFHLHTVHNPPGLEHSAAAFQRLIDMAIKRGGSYFLAHHRHATREQIEACYPQFAQFLRLKLQYDPEERFQSNWYRHYKAMFGDVL